MSFPSGSTTIIVTPWFSLFSQLDHSILAVDDAYELKERSEFESFLKLAAKGAIPFYYYFGSKSRNVDLRVSFVLSR